MVCDLAQVVLFERATFLVISNAVRTAHSDVHRFEKARATLFSSFRFGASRPRSSVSTCRMPSTCRPSRLAQVSNIIKQFKLSCSKTQAHFATMQV